MMSLQRRKHSKSHLLATSSPADDQGVIGDDEDEADTDTPCRETQKPTDEIQQGDDKEKEVLESDHSGMWYFPDTAI